MKSSKIKDMTFIALMTAVICIMGPISIPIGPVPISLTNLALFITIYVLGTKRSMIACGLYLLIGTAGLPVFSGFAGGPQKLVGPTGGYLVGFLAMTLIAGLVIDKFYENRIVCFIGMVAATWVLYVIGTAWLAYSAHMTFQAALAAGVIPFIIEDMVKMAAAAVVGPVLRRRLTEVGVLEA
ncbi:MAG: biotin transporter BioY [Anaerovoracaceae bacterium]